MVCKNHPGSTARRKCYECKSLICPQCQIKAHHHLFCSDACIAVFKGEPLASDTDAFAAQLHRLDLSLNEDLREYGEVIVDQLQGAIGQQQRGTDEKLSALQDALSAFQQTFLGYRTFLQQWAAGKDRQVDRAEKGARVLDRRARRRTQKTDRAIAETQTQLSAKHADLSQALDRLGEQLRALQSSAEAAQKTAREEHRAVLAATEREATTSRAQIEGEFQSLSGQTERRLHQVSKEIEAWLGGQSIEARTADERLTRLIETKVAELQTEYQRQFDVFARDVKSSYERQTNKALDDIATLLTAQKGNWSEVLAAAAKGSGDAARTLRTLLAKELSAQVVEVAKLESEGLRQVSTQAKNLLVHRIESQISPWPRRASWAAVALSVVTFAAVPFLFAHLRHAQETLWATWANRQTERFAEEVRTTLRENAGKTANAPEAKPVERIPAVANVSRGDTGRREVAFTFDGGSNSKAATDILDFLKAQQIRTTMFLTGEFIETHPELVRRIVADGHEVGNHLYRHAHLIDPVTQVHYTHDQLLNEMQQVEKVFFETTEKTMSKLWRAPYGEVAPAQIEAARQKGYIHVGWTRSQGRNLDTQDWVSDPGHKLFKSPDQIAAKIMSFEKEDRFGLNGAIVLMHLGSERTEKAMAHLALPNLFKNLQQKGYRIVPVSSILRTQIAQHSASIETHVP